MVFINYVVLANTPRKKNLGSDDGAQRLGQE